MEQIIRKISAENIKRIESQRNWVRNHFDPSSVEEYKSIEGKLSLINTIITSNWIGKEETNKLQCLGVTLGDILVQDLGFSWVEVEDLYGVDPAIKFGNTSLVLFPLTMISKRIENGETVDIYQLYNKLKMKVLEIKNKVD